jgi:AcrR family transcriptional regulator
MPRETFFNLPEEKRRWIQDVALEEFATWGFDNASINRIVEQCQIAKGSFYQYFTDKQDLFQYIFAHIIQEEIALLEPVIRQSESRGFFPVLEALYRAGLAFAQRSPQAALIFNQVMRNQSHPVHRACLSDGMLVARGLYAGILETAVANGEVRADLDVRFVAHILAALELALSDYYFEAVKQQAFDVQAIDEDLLETVELTLDFVKNGIRAR